MPIPEAETKEANPPQKQAKAEKAGEDNPVLKEHVLRETEVRPIHRFIGRIVKRLGMPLEADEQAALDEHGARFWSRWIRTSWGASAFAYGGTWGEIIVSRAIEKAIEDRRKATEASRSNVEAASKAGVQPIDGSSIGEQATGAIRSDVPPAKNGSAGADSRVVVDDKLADMGAAAYKD